MISYRNFISKRKRQIYTNNFETHVKKTSNPTNKILNKKISNNEEIIKKKNIKFEYVSTKRERERERDRQTERQRQGECKIYLDICAYIKKKCTKCEESL